MTLRVAIIGCGLIGTKRARSIPPTMSLIGVYDIDLNRARELSNSVEGHPEVHENLKQLFNSKPDVVFVATSHRHLAQVALRAILSGSHVFVEKPGAVSQNELQTLMKHANERGLTVAVGFNHRFHHAVIRVKQLVRAGNFGDLLWIRARYGHGGRAGYENEWRMNRAESGGGELVDQGSHLIDLVHFFAGPTRVLFAHIPTLFWKAEVEDNAFLALGFNDSNIAWLHASWTEWKNTFSFELTFRFGKLVISGLGGSYGRETLDIYTMRPEMGPPEHQVETWDGGDDSWRLEILDFERRISTGIATGATLVDALNVLRVVSTVYQR